MTNETSLAPIALFVYNRPWHTKQTIEALQKNELADQSELFIFSDGAKDDIDRDLVKEVRAYIKTINGFKKIVILEKEKNGGLATSIIDGVTSIINRYGKIIVLEDDLVTGPYFLSFMNDGLEMYEDTLKVSQIVGYSYFEKYIQKYNLQDTLFIKGGDCLGWGTWKNRWIHFDPSSSSLLEQIKNNNQVKEFNVNNSYGFYEMLEKESRGKVGSWAIRWYASVFLKNLYTLYPSKSLVLHIGNDKWGTNYNLNSSFDPLDVPIYENRIHLNKIDIFQKENSRKAYSEFLLQYKIPFFKKIIIKFKTFYKSMS